MAMSKHKTVSFKFQDPLTSTQQGKSKEKDYRKPEEKQPRKGSNSSRQYRTKTLYNYENRVNRTCDFKTRRKRCNK